MSPNILSSDLAEILANAKDDFQLLKDKNMFISGATGFFGKWLMQILIAANDTFGLNLKITIVTRDSSKSLTDQPWLNHSYIKLISGDISSFELTDEKFDFFIHGATAASASLNNSNPALMSDTIIDGTRRVLLQAKQSKGAKFLFISSGAVYGTQPATISHVSEDLNLGPDITHPLSSYAEAKRMAELYCQFANSNRDIQLSVARCYAFLGPYLPLDQHFAAGNFLGDATNNRDIIIQGDGLPYRSYMYPLDLIEWLLKILLHAKPGSVYNVGSDEEVTIENLAKKIASKSNNTSVQILGKQDRSKPRVAYVPSIQKANLELGLKIRYSLDESISRTLSWLKFQKGNL
jgi:nucleoside-diphosphate-sugar epimerase